MGGWVGCERFGGLDEELSPTSPCSSERAFVMSCFVTLTPPPEKSTCGCTHGLGSLPAAPVAFAAASISPTVLGVLCCAVHCCAVPCCAVPLLRLSYCLA